MKSRTFVSVVCAEKLLNLTGSNQEINYAPRSQATLVRNRIGSPRRASEEIGFTAQIEYLTTKLSRENAGTRMELHLPAQTANPPTDSTRDS